MQASLIVQKSLLVLHHKHKKILAFNMEALPHLPNSSDHVLFNYNLFRLLHFQD